VVKGKILDMLSVVKGKILDMLSVVKGKILDMLVSYIILITQLIR